MRDSNRQIHRNPREPLAQVETWEPLAQLFRFSQALIMLTGIEEKSVKHFRAETKIFQENKIIGRPIILYIHYVHLKSEPF